MSATSLDIFDRTIQTTNIWLKEISAIIGPDRQLAWKVLSTVLHKLRDRLPFEVSAHLGSQLPLLVRGVYYDQFRPIDQPNKSRHANEFIEEVGKWLSDVRPVDPKLAIIAVFGVLDRHVDAGQVAKIKNTLPHEIRDLWNEAAAQVMEPSQA
jgi:uncharacterized protein (DUF2267 family)